jgi:hypothetical protein
MLVSILRQLLRLTSRDQTITICNNASDRMVLRTRGHRLRQPNEVYLHKGLADRASSHCCAKDNIVKTAVLSHSVSKNTATRLEDWASGYLVSAIAR